MDMYHHLVQLECLDDREAYKRVVRNFHEAIYGGYELPKVGNCRDFNFTLSPPVETFHREARSTGR